MIKKILKYLLTLFLFFTFSMEVYSISSPPKYIVLAPKGAVYRMLEGQSLPDCKKEPKLCRKENGIYIFNLNVFEKPSLDSERIGKIEVLLQLMPRHKRGIAGYFINNKKQRKKMETFAKNTDWGYGNYFEFTVSSVKNDWVQLPKRPFGKPVWINMKRDWGEKYTRSVQTFKKGFFITPLGNLLITEFLNKKFKYRLEYPTDYNCADLDYPKPTKEELIIHEAPIEKLYDKDGHLLAKVTYPAGC